MPGAVAMLQLARQQPSTALSRVLRWTWKRHSRAALLFVAWLVHYLSGVRRVKLHRGRGGNPGSSTGARLAHTRLKRILEQCPSLSSVYWPTWYAHTAFLQFALLGLKELRARIFQRDFFRREVLALQCGERIALDWADPPTRHPGNGATDTRPVCVVLHGAFQDSASATMVDMAKSLTLRGLPVVVMNRRGYGGLGLGEEQAAAKVTMFGFDTDLDEVLEAVNRRYPGRPVAIIGFSCGAGYATRFTGARAGLTAWQTKEEGKHVCRAHLLCSVAYDPGYDVSPEGAVTLIRPPYSWVVNLMIKYCYVFRHRGTLRGSSASADDIVNQAMSPTHGLQDTYKAIRRLAGAGGSSAWLDMQQPRLEQVAVPSLMINSRDDPVCVWENVERFRADIVSNPNLVLAEMQQGSHGCKFGFWGFDSVAFAMIGEFVTASWKEWVESSKT